MTDETPIQELEAHKDVLLAAASLSERIASGNLPEPLVHADLSGLLATANRCRSRGVFGDEAELTEFLADFVERSEDGLRKCLLSDIGQLEQVLATGEDQVGHTAFGMAEGYFPVRVDEQVVHVLHTGRLRDQPFTGETVAEIAEVAGEEPDKILEAAGAVPLLAPEQAEALYGLYRATRDAMEQTLAGYVEHGRMARRLVDAERTRSLGTLSGGMAHHFNNLLSVILGYASFVLNKGQHGEAIAAALLKISEAAQRGRRLTEEILAFSGGDIEEDAPCHVHETLANILSLMETELGSQVRIDRAFNARNDLILSPPSSVHQILFNLVTNGLDSMPGGGVLTVSTDNVMLKDESETTEYLQLAVTDTSGLLPEGVAAGRLEEDVLAAIPAEDRYGLPLASVYGMVGRMAGTVTVSSEPGASTRVEVLLPTSHGQHAADREKPVRTRLAPSNIWVVDDDAIFREMCHQVLTEEGHTPLELDGGKDLHEHWKARETDPHLIIMDFSMPEYNGLELCEWLRSHGSHVPVVLVSGFSVNQPDIKKALRMRKTYFLQKPFTSRDLTDTVTVAMGETLIGE